jgi:hypothetical protein
MARNAAKHAKRVAQRRAKRKAKQDEFVRRKNMGLAEKLERAAVAPVLDCCVVDGIWEMGIGTVLLSRKLPDGQVAFGNFLVDVQCLGVKDADGDIIPQSVYRERLLEPMRGRMDLVDVEPAYARKLVEGAVAYAAELGFRPHRDYERARPIFGDIDPSECRDEFEFGQDGKPFFVSGPYDSPEKCRRIVHQLHEHCGPGGYEYIVHVSDAELEDELLSDEA